MRTQTFDSTLKETLSKHPIKPWNQILGSTWGRLQDFGYFILTYLLHLFGLNSLKSGTNRLTKTIRWNRHDHLDGKTILRKHLFFEKKSSPSPRKRSFRHYIIWYNFNLTNLYKTTYDYFDTIFRIIGISFQWK